VADISPLPNLSFSGFYRENKQNIEKYVDLLVINCKINTWDCFSILLVCHKADRGIFCYGMRGTMTELFYFPKRKKKTIRRFCKILSTDSYIPEKVVENEEIIEKYHPSFKNEVIVKP